MTAWQFDTLAMFGYDTIVADLPWDFENYSDAGTKKGADPHYAVMPLEAIKVLPVHELARGDCLLLLWTKAGPSPPVRRRTLRGRGASSRFPKSFG
jgi:N6-adenosine-specific RNA methylase IME4